ncbi:EsaB/YukD family protein [Actinoallomurus rhizosphaericola]|uniref:EsaB/YukD family protein n=1 Tax=Actinoallomurus rhizosphaericola TaxID=2952536 RepID=UPI002092BAA5|nr:EsaB/YukD family protein [Actinoallomurus rhizosphaericola]MCO5996337.1 hypothetical protein [Actinoallomurus rhizosphaericola]
MTEGEDLCRVTIDGPQRRLDLALPVDVPFADLLPLILDYSGRDLAEAGLEHDGWVLQRLDEAPIQEAMTPAQIGLTHGEVLFLRPAMRQFPELSVDETGRRGEDVEGPSPDWSYGYILTVAASVPSAAVILLLLGGPPWGAPAVVAAVLSLVLISVAAVACRFERTAGVGAVCGLGAVPPAFLAGFLATLDTPSIVRAGPEQLLLGLSATGLIAVLAAAVTARLITVFAAVVGTAVVGAAAAGLALAVPRFSAAEVAALTLAVVLPGHRLFQAVIRRIHTPMPQVPAGLEDTPGEPARARVERLTEELLTGAAVAVTAAVFAGDGVMSFTARWPARVTCAVVAATALARVRSAHDDVQRLAFALAGTSGLIWLGVGFSDGHGSLPAILSVAVLVAGAAAILPACLWSRDRRRAERGRRPVPVGLPPGPFPLSRTVGIAEVMLTAAVIPLALTVAGVFTG